MSMVHRHLTHGQWTLAAIDDAIGRGVRADWRELRQCADRDPLLRHRIIRVCAPRLGDPYAQRYHLWNDYARAFST